MTGHEVAVYVDDDTTGDRPVRAGTAWFTVSRGVTSTTFGYDREFLSARRPGQRSAWAVSPELSLSDGRGHTVGLPGAFGDAAPDRWGRMLVAKRIRARARAEGRAVRAVSDVDHLLGVTDETRQGALRFSSTAAEDVFLAEEPGVPTLLELPKLMRAAEAVARDDDDAAALKTLLDAGSASLGGARPKASVRDGDRLLIAKFGHPSDDWDVMAWEKTTLDLAERAGIRSPRRRLVRVGARHVLLLERFDRAPTGRRIGYVSGMTLVGASDGESHDYLELAEALADHGEAVATDLVELWRRIAFSLAVGNVDDHLRNHGFLRGRAGWRLSPVFDVNPDPDGADRVTSVGWVTDRTGAAQALVSAAPVFGVGPDVQAVLDQVRRAVAGWRGAASANGVTEREVHRFAPLLDAAADLWD